ncbi:MAG: type II toxin-antitoxin system Phd/YefM family antitoxin [Planctomycetaceae bacterium]|nr:MAG: type II toxin-antitoxin system Phd/YefM family antitoxin [Planctomycetaceae bacterium]
MKFVTVRDIRTFPAKIWKQLPEEQEMVITNNSRPIALLTPISDQSLEQTLSAVRRARAMAAIQRMQKTTRELGLDRMTEQETEQEIDDEIRAGRRERNR